MSDARPLPSLPAKRFLSRQEAAEYVGVSASTFDYEVAQRWWPPAIRRGARDGRLTWDRVAIDAAADRLSSLSRDNPTGEGTLAGFEQAALEAASNGSKRPNGRQHGHAKKA